MVTTYQVYSRQEQRNKIWELIGTLEHVPVFPSNILIIISKVFCDYSGACDPYIK